MSTFACTALFLIIAQADEPPANVKRFLESEASAKRTYDAAIQAIGRAGETVDERKAVMRLVETSKIKKGAKNPTSLPEPDGKPLTYSSADFRLMALSKAKANHAAAIDEFLAIGRHLGIVRLGDAAFGTFGGKLIQPVDDPNLVQVGKYKVRKFSFLPAIKFPIEVGDIGSLATDEKGRGHVLRVIDAQSVIVKAIFVGGNTTTLLLKGVSTKAMADNSAFICPDCFEVTGTDRVGGRTMFVIVPLDLGQVAKWREKAKLEK